MSKPVLFATGLGRPLERAENIATLYRSYHGEKVFMCSNDWNFRSEVNSGKYDLLVIDVFPFVSPGKSIMVWHAIQGGKYIGLDEANTYYRPEYAKYADAIITAGHGAIDMFHRCTHVSMEKMLNLGMPRTDKYIGKQKGDGHTILSGKRAYLYAPTFRARGEPPLPDIDWQYINDRLSDDEVFAVKAHPYTWQMDVPDLSHVVKISGAESSSPYLYDADVVITDYSSIMFDAYLLGKPVVLFEKNPGYIIARGMYLNYPDQYSSWYTQTERDLLTCARIAYDTGLGPIEKRCMKIVADACDGHSCERICQLIDSMNTPKEVNT